MSEKGDVIGQTEGIVTQAPQERQDELQRRVQEKDYSSCWKEAEFPRGRVYISRLYYFPDPPRPLKFLVQKDLAEISVGKNIYGKTEPDLHEVRYVVDLKKLNLPETLHVSEYQHVPFILEYARMYEELNIASSVKGEVVRELCNSAAFQLNEVLEILRSNGIIDKNVYNLPERFWEEVGQRVLSHSSLETLQAKFPDFKQTSDPEFISSVYDYITEIIESRCSRGKRQDFLDELDGDVIGLGRALTPHALIFHDDWIDSRFTNGFVKAGYVMGSIRTTHGGWDIDAPAFIELRRLGMKSIDPNKRQSDGLPILYAPPNMTNAYMVRIPVISDEIFAVENFIEVVEDPLRKEFDGCIGVIICEELGRLHPEKIPQALNGGFGENQWLLVRHVKGESGELRLVHCVPKEKKEWQVKLKKPRPNLPLLEM